MRIEYDWNNETDTWIINDKIEYMYDGEGNLTIQSIYSKDEYIYDTNGYLTMNISYSRSSETAPWENSDKVQYTYESGKLQSIYYEWDAKNSSWIEYNREEVEIPLDTSVLISDIIIPLSIFYNNDEIPFFLFSRCKPISMKFSGDFMFYYSDLPTGILDSSNPLSEAIVYRTANHTVAIEQAALGAQVRVYSPFGRIVAIDASNR